MLFSVPKRTKVFISYSHKDTRYLDGLLPHLKYLEKNKLIDLWADTKINPGEKWKDKIELALVSAKVAILLISIDFLTSQFIVDSELPVLLAAAEKEGVTILPIILRPCLLPQSLSQFQMLNSPSRPLAKMKGVEREELWVKVATAIMSAMASQTIETHSFSTRQTHSLKEKDTINQLEKKEANKSYWTDFDNLEQELLLFIRRYGTVGVMPTVEELRRHNRISLQSAIDQNGGHTAVARQLGLRVYVAQEDHVQSQAVILETAPKSSGISGHIYNPYADYALGSIVKDAQMFYGRDEIITEISEGITNSSFAHKTIIIFGQKRSGMSSILYHLHRVLNQHPDLLSLIENMSLYFDETSYVPIFYQILWSILEKLKYEIEGEIDDEPDSLVHSLPEMGDFYNHPAPFHFFKETIKNIIKIYHKRIVVLFDDFSYLYGIIMKGHLSTDFMKNWKFLLQEDFFSCVLSGDDLMPQFIMRFPNELTSTESLRVGPLSAEDAVKLIDEPIRIGGKSGESRFRGQAIERIVALTNGYPFFIQLFCNRLVEYMNRKQAALITEADVDQVQFELIQGANSLSWEVFDHLINPNNMFPDAISKEDETKVLTAIAFNSRTELCSLKSIMDTVGETQSAISDILEDLVYRRVIELRKGHYYRICVELFRDWLITHSVRS